MGLESFYVTPYDPKTWKDSENVPDTETQSSLEIDFRDFVTQLRNKFSKVDIGQYAWSAQIDEATTVTGDFFGPKHQILRLSPYEDFAEFVIWYRTYISLEYPLFLFQQGSWSTLQIDENTSVQDIENFAGFPDELRKP